MSETMMAARVEACQGRAGRRPAWGALYLLLAATLATVTAVEFLLPAGSFRMIAEGVGALTAFGEIALWVHVNRLHLVDEGGCCTMRITVRVVQAAPSLPWPGHAPATGERRVRREHETLV